MTLEESIDHAAEKANDPNVCKGCRENHGQLAAWLAELKSRRDAETRAARSLPEALELKKSAKKYGLLHVEVLDEYPDEILIEQYNGVGPDRWPEELRDVLSWLLEDVLEAVEVHDMDYYRGGSRERFFEANAVLGKNIRKLARKKYGWWRPRRYFLGKLSHKLTEWTDKYGWEGWTKEKRSKQK